MFNKFKKMIDDSTGGIINRKPLSITIPKATSHDLAEVNRLKKENSYDSWSFRRLLNSVLYDAVDENNLYIAHHIMSKYKDELNTESNYLILSARNEDGLKMQKLLYDMELEFDEEDLSAALATSFSKGNEDISQFLIEKGADINYRDNSLVKNAINNNNIDELKECIKFGVKVRKSDLITAIKGGKQKFIDVLATKCTEKVTFKDLSPYSVTKSALKWLKKDGFDFTSLTAKDIGKFSDNKDILQFLLQECGANMDKQGLIDNAFNSFNTKEINTIIELYPEEITTAKLKELLDGKETKIGTAELCNAIIASNVKFDIDLLEAILLLRADNSDINVKPIYSIIKNEENKDMILENDNILLKTASANSMQNFVSHLLEASNKWNPELLSQLLLNAAKEDDLQLFRALISGKAEIPLSSFGKASEVSTHRTILDHCKRRINDYLGDNWEINEELEVINTRSIGDNLYMKDIFNFEASRQTTITMGRDSNFKVEHSQFIDIDNKTFIDAAYSKLTGIGYSNLPQHQIQNQGKDSKSPVDLINSPKSRQARSKNSRVL